MKPALTRRQPPTLERAIQAGLLALVTLMPFHAFLSVWLGTLFAHRSLIQSWKEVLLIILSALTVALLIREPWRLAKLHQPAVIALGGFLGIGLIVTLLTHPPLTTIIFGLKIDSEFLLAALIALIVATPEFIRRLVIVTLAAAAIVIVFGLLQAFILPPDFLTHFGYGSGTIVPYQHLDARNLRFASTLGGPNQLGTYLIIPMSLALALMWQKRNWWLGLGIILAAIVLIHTYSRGAWLGALIALATISFGTLPRRIKPLALTVTGLLVVIIVAMAPLLVHSPFVQHYVLHGYDTFGSQKGSDFEHLASLQSGGGAVLTQPLGHGFGTAGPSVFQTGAGRIIEDYYLQLGYETGLLGMLLFILGIVLLGQKLWRHATIDPYALAITAILAGISVNALVLPVWTDSTGALVFWILAGAVLAQYSRSKEAGFVTTT